MTLRYIGTVAWIGLITVTAALCYATVAGHFHTDGAALLRNPWGLAAVVDIYVGFALFSCWVAWRESRVIRALTWIVLIALGGNFVSAVYVLIALRSSGGDFEAFWHGPRYEDLRSGQRNRAIQSKEQWK
jgi:hypothetical protein